ncbi:MAG TPA: hypothetical protein PLQ36_01440 [Candidatus Gracilibacteria bacterium]|nr:hypothetical protein [Candidatus Gracilibacteria bacterium]
MVNFNKMELTKTDFTALDKSQNNGQKEFKNYQILKKNIKGVFEPYKAITEYDRNEFINILREAQINRSAVLLFQGEVLQINQISVEEIKDFKLSEKQFKFMAEELLIVVKDKRAYKGTYQGNNVFLQKVFIQDGTNPQVVDNKKIPLIKQLGVKYCVYIDGKREFINKDDIQFALAFGN